MGAMLREVSKGCSARHLSYPQRVQAAAEELATAGMPVSFYSVASRAQIARSTLYRRADLRAIVEAARSASPAQTRSMTSLMESAQLEAKVAELEAVRQKLEMLLQQATAEASQEFMYYLVPFVNTPTEQLRAA